MTSGKWLISLCVKLLKYTFGFISALTSFLPHKRYNIFIGTTSFYEWLTAIKLWIVSTDYQNEGIIQLFEQKFSRAANCKFAVSFGSGRMALYALLEVLDIGKGDEVIISPFTCVVVPNALIYRSIKPIYADISLSDFNMDVRKVERLITEKTKAIYVQNTFGVLANLRKIKELADRYNLLIIEDAAHSLGSIQNDPSASDFADATFYSTDHSKTINTYLGGVVTTNQEEYAVALRAYQTDTPFLSNSSVRAILRSYVFEWLYFAPYCLWIGRYLHAGLRKFRWVYTFNDELLLTKPTKYPYPCRLSAPQALLGAMQLDKLRQNVQHRREIAKILEGEIQYYRFDQDKMDGISWIRYSFLVQDRSAFIRQFERKFDLGIWFTSIFEGRLGDFHELYYTAGSCPNAEFAAAHVVNFPTHQRIPAKLLERELLKKKLWLKAQLIKKP